MKNKVAFTFLIPYLALFSGTCQAIEGSIDCNATIRAWKGDASLREYMSTQNCDCRNGNGSSPVCTSKSGASQSASGRSGGSSAHKKSGNDAEMMMLQGMQNYLNQAGQNNKQAYEKSRQVGIESAAALNEAQQSALQSEEERRLRAAREEMADREQGNQEIGAQLQGMPGSSDRPTLDIAGALNQDSKRNKAGDQLKSVEFHSKTAARFSSDEAMKDEASKGFDTGGKYAGSLPVIVPEKEKVIPKEKITPEIKKMMDERDEVKEKRKELEKDLEKLEAKKEKTPEDTVEMAKLKQDISTAKNKENYDDYAINEELKKPAKLNPEK
jgi:hypothetical protein